MGCGLVVIGSGQTVVIARARSARSNPAAMTNPIILYQPVAHAKVDSS
jgi:hypothetical protein